MVMGMQESSELFLSPDGQRGGDDKMDMSPSKHSCKISTGGSAALAMLATMAAEEASSSLHPASAAVTEQPKSSDSGVDVLGILVSAAPV